MSEHAAVVTLLADWPQLPFDTPFSDPCGERVRQAVCGLVHDPAEVGPRDLAGLVSHWLHRETAADRGNQVRVPRGVGWPTEQQWADAGLSVVTRDGDTLRLAPGAGWSPEWLVCDTAACPLAPAFAESVRRDPAPGPFVDPCLADALGERFTRFTGPGQQQAVRAAFFLPPGETLLAVLPTGAGKSLVGLAPAVAGWPTRGTTLVVVPTVALGFDQEHQARHLLNRAEADVSQPLAWHSGLSEDDRRLIRGAVRDGTQLILFASPEAVVRGLAPALFDAAERGLLRSLVIDEAHLVAQWGNDFRPEFQAVAGLRQELLAACPPDAQLRTTLLTATLTQESYDTLNTLFGPLRTVAAVHLRPEPAYWVRRADGWDEQQAWVLETCRRVPRPFLLYVTEQRHAEEWAERLRADGMKRVRFVHGGSADREEVLDLWRANRIDAVVATSAFGLGMDKGDVRAVIHACVPETVDRYYQEVGRGGRDGKACVAVAVYTAVDRKEAGGLNRERVITTKLGLERWEALFATRPPASERNEVFAVDLRAKRQGVTRDNDANVAWNLQTLNLMARSGLIELRAARPPVLEPEPGELDSAFERRADAAFERYFHTARVRLLGGHNLRDLRVWEGVVQAERERTAGAGGDQLALLDDMLAGKREFADALAEAYRVEGGTWIEPTPVCGGCPTCRRNGDDPTGYSAPHPDAPFPSRPADPRLVAAAGVPAGAELAVVTYRPPTDPRDRRRWDDLVLRVLLPRLIALGVREVSASGRWAGLPTFRRLHHLCPERYLLFTSIRETDAGGWAVPRLTLLDPADPPQVLPAGLLALARPFHLLLVPGDVRDPDRPADPYSRRHPTAPLDSLLERTDR